MPPSTLDSEFLAQVRIPLGIDLEAVRAKEPRMRSWDLGPLLQGMLMECVVPEVAERLHGLPFNPYSQYCECAEDGKALVWVLNALTNEAYELVLQPVVQLAEHACALQDGQPGRVGNLCLKRLDVPLHLGESQEMRFSRRELVALVHEDAPATFTLNFTTPTAFKSAGVYQIMPNMHLIYQNLLMRYGQIFEGNNEVDQDTVDYLATHTRITRYKLRSQTFALAGKRIPAFMGSLTVRVSGASTLRGFVRMLFRFGEFGGIGIKTSMGMGGFNLG